jgi:fibrillarin-like pre-rRNA processing protein
LFKKVEPHTDFAGVYWITLPNGKKRLATKNLAPGKGVYGERLVSFRGNEYRIWDPYRSKLAAVILNGLNFLPIMKGHKVLYLGAASGTTASHVSDIVGKAGQVYCVEFSARTMRELVSNLCDFRFNITPLLEDSRFPEKYTMFVEQVDDIYCDIAQPEQAKVLADNAKLFLKQGGWTMLAVKSQSIDVTKRPAEIYEREMNVLRNRGFDILDAIQLEPYDKAHVMIVSKI